MFSFLDLFSGEPEPCNEFVSHGSWNQAKGDSQQCYSKGSVFVFFTQYDFSPFYVNETILNALISVSFSRFCGHAFSLRWRCGRMEAISMEWTCNSCFRDESNEMVPFLNFYFFSFYIFHIIWISNSFMMLMPQVVRQAVLASWYSCRVWVYISLGRRSWCSSFQSSTVLHQIYVFVSFYLACFLICMMRSLYY